jgi:hypothetical protein
LPKQIQVDLGGIVFVKVQPSLISAYVGVKTMQQSSGQKDHKSALNFDSLINVLMLSGLSLLSLTASAMDGGQNRRLFVTSAVENTVDDTVQLPLYRGTSQGQAVWYVVLDASNGNFAQKYGVNRADKLNNAKNTAAVQRVSIVNGVFDFPATVNFKPDNKVVAGPTGFPPLAVQPGAEGLPGYSPLIQLPDGTILNAPHLANGSGQASKVVALDTVSGNVVYKETKGFANGKEVRYISTDSSGFAAAALENVTFAEQLNNAPFLGGDSTDSARATLAGFVNGQTGVDNPDRQGLSSALLDGLDPLNVLRWTPNQGRYSPLWDVNLGMWSDTAIAGGINLLQKDVGTVQGLGKENLLTAPGGGKFGPAGFIVNCPIISELN